MNFGQDHRFHKLAAWAETQFGPASEMAMGIRSVEPWVKSVVQMRNAVDHPTHGPKGKLVVTNFSIHEYESSSFLQDPSWNLVGDAAQKMAPAMDSIIEKILEISELFLVHIFNATRGPLALKIIDIPLGSRDPSAPVRLRVVPNGWSSTPNR